MRRQRRTLALLGGALVVALSCPGGAPGTVSAGAATLPGKPRVRAHAKPAPAPEVTLTAALGAGAEVTMAPVGLSLEYPVMAADLGSGPCPPAALTAELLRLGSPPLALAGASQDETAPAGALGATPGSWETATLYSLPAAFWSQLHCLLSATADPLTVGINLRSGQLSWAAQMVAGAQSAATAGLDFSLGNEPDLYSLPNYSSLDRPQQGEETLAVNTYLQVAAYIQQALAGAPVIGPELARPAQWQHELPRVIETLHDHTVGVHMYPLSACASPRAVTLAGLLSAQAADAPQRLAWVVADALRAGVGAIISEANSASCGGETGVSDSPAAAVWAVRFVLAALETGFREVRFHFSGNPYDPFVVHGEQLQTRPLESAMAALNRWLPIGSSLSRLAGVRGLEATRLTTPAGAAMLVLDNESAQPRAVVLRGTPSVLAETFGPSRSGPQSTQLSATRGRIKLEVAANSVIALSAATS